MPPGNHYSRSASFVCHWHTGCSKRFPSKRQLYRHLETEHGLRRDDERGWRAPGVGARARRREIRERRPRSPRSPQERGVIAMLNQTPYSPHIASRVRFASDPALLTSSAAQLPSLGPSSASVTPSASASLGFRSAGLYSSGGAQPSDGIGREAVIGSSPAGPLLTLTLSPQRTIRAFRRCAGKGWLHQLGG